MLVSHIVLPQHVLLCLDDLLLGRNRISLRLKLVFNLLDLLHDSIQPGLLLLGLFQGGVAGAGGRRAALPTRSATRPLRSTRAGDSESLVRVDPWASLESEAAEPDRNDLLQSIKHWQSQWHT